IDVVAEEQQELRAGGEHASQIGCGRSWVAHDPNAMREGGSAAGAARSVAGRASGRAPWAIAAVAAIGTMAHTRIGRRIMIVSPASSKMTLPREPTPAPLASTWITHRPGPADSPIARGLADSPNPGPPPQGSARS